MSVQNRTTLRGFFDTGDTVTSGAMIDLVDSGANLADTSAQSFASEISTPNLVAARVSASALNITGSFTASAATFGGRVRQGVNTGTSGSTTLGDMLVAQETTVASNTTVQVAFLPTTSNIAAIKVKMLVNGSAAAGGVRINAGNSDARNFFGTITVSALGMYEFTAVSAVRLTGVSGRVEMVASGASAGTNIIGTVLYYQRV